ncbi:MAG: YicC family protein [Verrucomicrobia bacterium]|nr:MAG: YicC family protein [Verrucomicrobiota bacterium]
MRSMTGHGRGVASGEGCRLSVEVAGVNRRQADVQVSLPRELDPLEPRVREAVLQRINRGRVSVRVKLVLTAPPAGEAALVNRPLARAYAAEFRRLQKELRLPEPPGLELILRAPGVLQPPAETDRTEVFWPVLEKALRKALDAMDRMRRKEGAHLARDLRERVKTLRRMAREVRKLAPEVPRRAQDQLLQRLAERGLEGIDPADERILKEVALFADRCDITEELTRLDSHFQQWDGLMRSKEPVGRTLDFLLQEMFREVNTIGSKAADARVSALVVGMKTELEKLREQVQNIE